MESKSDEQKNEQITVKVEPRISKVATSEGMWSSRGWGLAADGMWYGE